MGLEMAVQRWFHKLVWPAGAEIPTVSCLKRAHKTQCPLRSSNADPSSFLLEKNCQAEPDDAPFSQHSPFSFPEPPAFVLIASGRRSDAPMSVKCPGLEALPCTPPKTNKCSINPIIASLSNWVRLRRQLIGFFEILPQLIDFRSPAITGGASCNESPALAILCRGAGSLLFFWMGLLPAPIVQKPFSVVA